MTILDLDRLNRNQLIDLARLQLRQPLTFGIFIYPDKRVAQLGTYYVDACQHTHIVGRTGTGKSTMVVNLACATINNNMGCLVIDPHRDLVADIMARVPAHREKDVCLVSAFPLSRPPKPTDTSKAAIAAWRLRAVAADRYPGLNLLSCPNPDDGGLVASQALSVFQKVIGANWDTAVRMQRVLTMCLYAMVGWKADATLEDMYKFLINEEFRLKIIAADTGRRTNRHVKTFWLDEFAAFSESEQSGIIAPVITRIQKFLTNDIADRIVNQRKTTVDFRYLMDHGKIVLAPVAQALGEDLMRFLGTLLVVKMRAAGVSRESLPEDGRSPFSVFIDECHNFIMPDLVQALSEDRKRRIAYFLAHQFLGQLKQGGLLDAVFGNVGTRIVFKVSQDDASYIARGIDGLTAEDIGGLQRFWAYSSFLVDAVQAPVCSMQTFPKPPERHDAMPMDELVPIPGNYGDDDLALVKTVYDLEDLDGQVTLLKQKLTSDKSWQYFEAARQAYDLGLRRKLLQYPQLVPDKSERITILSALKYGLPRFQIEAAMHQPEANEAVPNQQTGTSPPQTDTIKNVMKKGKRWS